jgi:tetratricopeptide (TPR) repeat protein
MRNGKLFGAMGSIALVALLVSGATRTAAAEKLSHARDVLVNVQVAPVDTAAKQPAEIEADAMLARGEYAAAVGKYQQLDLKDARIVNKLGIAYEYLGGTKKAQEDYERAIQLDPTLAAAYNNLATIYYSEHDNKKAEKFYKKAIRLDPGNASAYKNLGTAYFADRKYGKGSEMYAVAMKIDPDIFNRNKALDVSEFDRERLAEMNYFLAELCAEHGQMNAALAYLDKAVGFGFHDAHRLYSDRALSSVRQMPGFEGVLRDGFKR